MARTIKQRISLDGAQEIKSALQEIGEAGRKAFEEIRKGIRDAGDVAPRLNRALDDLDKQYARFRRSSDNLALSTRNLKLRFSELSDATGVMVRRIGLISGAAALAGGALFGLTKTAADNVDQMGRLADGLGLPIEELGRLQYAADQFGAGDALGPALLQFQMQVAEAAEAARAGARTIGDATSAAGVAVIRGTDGMKNGFADVGVTVTRAGEQVRTATTSTTNFFEQLGIDVLDAQGNTRSLVDLFKEFSDAYRNLPDNADKTAVGAKALGEDDLLKLGSLLKASSQELERLGDEGEKVGAVFNEADRELSRNFLQALNKVTASAGRARDRLGLAFGPAFVELFDGIGRVILDNQGRIQQFADETAASVLGIVRDVTRVLRGESGPIENTWILELRDGFITVRDAAVTTVNVIRGAFNGLATALDYTIVPILRLFGVEVTGKGLILTGIVLQLTGAFRVLGGVLGTLNAGRKFFVDLYRNLREGRGLIAAFIRFVRTSDGAFSPLQSAARVLGDVVKGVFGAITGAASQMVRLVKGAIFGLVLNFSLLSGSIGSVLKSFTSLSGIARLISGAFGFIARAAGFLVGALAGIVGWPAVIIAGFVALAAATYLYWDEIVEVVQKAWAVIGDVLAGAVDTVRDFAGRAWAGVTASASAAWDEAVRLAGEGWDGVVNVTSAAAGLVASAAGHAWDAIAEAGSATVSAAASLASSVWDSVVSATAGARGALATAAASAWAVIETAADGLAARLAPVWDNIRTAALGALSSVASLVVEAWSGATDAVAASAEAIRAAIQRATEIAGDVAGAAELAAQLVQPFLDARSQISSIIATFAGVAESGLSSILTVVDNIADAIERRLAELLSRLRAAAAEARKLASEASSGGSSGGSTTGEIRTVEQRLATGGMVYGPGTKTSDSILARLSRGEFVVRAAAVEKYGPGLLAAINGLRFKMPKFATGGLVGGQQIRLPSFDGVVSGINASLASMVPAPAFAGGGLVPQMASGGRPLILDLGGGKQISAGTVGQDVVVELMRAAKGRSSAQIGRKPGWAGA